MLHPATCIPLLSSNPVGWLLLGGAGYLAYRTGKKSAKTPAEELEQVGLHDRAVKGAMKAACKAKIKIENSLAETKEKYGAMWSEAREEIDAGS